MTIITVTFAALGVLATQIDTGYNLFHKGDVIRLEKMIIASNAKQDKRIELEIIKSERRDINYQIIQLQEQQDQLWARHPMTGRDQIRAKKIERRLKSLEKDLDELLERKKEILRVKDE